jgi:hypothetical protein
MSIEYLPKYRNTAFIHETDETLRITRISKTIFRDKSQSNLIFLKNGMIDNPLNRLKTINETIKQATTGKRL